MSRYIAVNVGPLGSSTNPFAAEGNIYLNCDSVIAVYAAEIGDASADPEAPYGVYVYNGGQGFALPDRYSSIGDAQNALEAFTERLERGR